MTAALLLGAVACAAEDSEGPAASPKAEAPAPKPEPREPAEDPWLRFTDARFAANFELPPGWTAAEISTSYSDQGLYQFDIFDQAATGQLYFSTKVQGLGGACPDPSTFAEVQELDSESMQIPGYVPPSEETTRLQVVEPRFVYRVVEFSDRVVASVAVSNDLPPAFCYYYNLLHTADGAMVFADTMNPAYDSLHVFATVEEARAFMQTDEYRTLKRVLMSLRLEP